MKKHIIKTFEIEMPPKMWREVKATFMSEVMAAGEPMGCYMLALQPIARRGAMRVSIIGAGLGDKIAAVIEKHKAQDAKSS